MRCTLSSFAAAAAEVVAAAAVVVVAVELAEFAFVTATHDPKGPAIALLRHLTMQASPFGPPVHCTPL